MEPGIVQQDLQGVQCVRVGSLGQLFDKVQSLSRNLLPFLIGKADISIFVVTRHSAQRYAFFGLKGCFSDKEQIKDQTDRVKIFFKKLGDVVRLESSAPVHKRVVWVFLLAEQVSQRAELVRAKPDYFDFDCVVFIINLLAQQAIKVEQEVKHASCANLNKK